MLIGQVFVSVTTSSFGLEEPEG